MTPELIENAEETLASLQAAGLMVATVESCTGGLIAAALTEVPGSSASVERGFVTYSNAAKTELVDVPATLIEAHGAVSPEVAAAMAAGGLARSSADIAVAVTGIAGPGGSEFKPEGLVCFHAVRRGGTSIADRIEFGAIGRANVREKTVLRAFELIAEVI
ncbi:MAG: CinA family protein [Pseudomonadota bacterium]